MRGEDIFLGGGWGVINVIGSTACLGEFLVKLLGPEYLKNGTLCLKAYLKPEPAKYITPQNILVSM